MRRALGIILWVAVVLWALGGWAVVALIAYNNASPATLAPCPAPKPLHFPDVRP